MQKRGRARYLPLIGLIVVFWVLLIGMVVFVDPLVIKDFPFRGAFLGFLVVVFFAVLFLLTLILKSLRRGFIYGLGVVIILGLRLIHLGNIINVGLIIGLLVVIDVYFNQLK